MVKRTNLLALAALGALVERPMHPYELASALRSQGKGGVLQLRGGSLYASVQGLEKSGYVETVEVSRQGGRPERTVYAITDAGRVELTQWLTELLAGPEREYSRFEAALSLVAVIAPTQAENLLRRRLQELEVEVAEQRSTLDSAELPRVLLLDAEYRLALIAAETGWLRGVLEDLADGSFQDLAGWRDFHRTGQVPAAFTTPNEEEN